MGENVVHIKNDNWKSEVLDSDIPVLADFWAEWCAPCRVIAPILEDLAGELAGKMKVTKVNVDENQELAVEFGIRSVPSLLIFSGGSVKEQMVGAISKADLLEKLNAYL